MDDFSDNQIAPAEVTAEQPSAAESLPSESSLTPSASSSTSAATAGTKATFSLLAPAIAIVAWFVPGLGHLLLRRWGRALVFFVAVGGLAVSGYLMRGNVFPPHSDDPFGTLGFIADACSGVFYLLSRVFEAAGADVSRAIGDYGTRFIAGAGIVNVVAICDAYEIAMGRRR